MRVIILGFSVDIQESSRSSCHMDRLAQRSRSPVEFMRSSAARSPILNRPCPRGVRSRQLRSPDGLPSGSQQLERSRGRPSSRSRSRSSSRLHIRQPSRRRTGQCSESRSRHLYHLRVPSHRQGRSRSHQRERLRSRERSRSRSTPRSRESRRSVRTQNYPSCHRGRLLDNGESTQFANSGLQQLLDALKYASLTDNNLDKANIRDEINTHIEACQQNQKESFDKHRCIPPKYNVGDLVRVERQVPATGQSKKLVPKFQGPYRIASILDHDRFAIEDTPLTSKRGRSFSTIVAIDKIKPWLNFNRPHVSGTYSSESDDEESRE
ncbi:unnamed protein product, partial [Brenthis ino]